MRVALVLTGHMRCWEKVFPNTKTHIIDKYNPDVFIHTWSEEAYWAPHSAAGVTSGTKLDVDGVIEAYKPQKIVLEDQSKIMPIIEKYVDTRFENHYHVKKNIASMLRKMALGVGLLKEGSLISRKDQYDLVIRMRPDLVLSGLPDLHSHKFYTIRSKNHVGKGTSDVFQASSFREIVYFVDSMWYSLELLYEKHGLLCPHELSELAINTVTNSEWEELSIPFSLMHTPMGMYVSEHKYRQQV